MKRATSCALLKMMLKTRLYDKNGGYYFEMEFIYVLIRGHNFEHVKKKLSQIWPVVIHD